MSNVWRHISLLLALEKIYGKRASIIFMLGYFDLA